MRQSILFLLAGVGIGMCITPAHDNVGRGEDVTLSVRTDTVVIEKPREAARRKVAEMIEVTVRDTVFMVEREERIYTDSSTYRAVVSGLDARLDSLTLLRPVVTRQVNSIRHWGIGVTAGLTFSPRGVTPGVTVGLTYIF